MELGVRLPLPIRSSIALLLAAGRTASADDGRRGSFFLGPTTAARAGVAHHGHALAPLTTGRGRLFDADVPQLQTADSARKAAYGLLVGTRCALLVAPSSCQHLALSEPTSPSERTKRMQEQHESNKIKHKWFVSTERQHVACGDGVGSLCVSESAALRTHLLLLLRRSEA